jgi:hypothetical protein
MRAILMTVLIGFCLVNGTNEASALCNPGTKNCVTAPPNQPKPCYKTARGCSIDGGLGSTCQGGDGTNCGTSGQTLGSQIGGMSSQNSGGGVTLKQTLPDQPATVK